MEQEKTGLRATAIEPETKNNPIFAAILTLLFCVALWGTVLSMLGWTRRLPVPAAVSALALYPLLCRNRKAVRLAGGALLLAVAGFVAVYSRFVGAGLALLANRLFDVSAATQRYLYQNFSVSDAEAAAAIRCALIALAAGFSVCAAWISAWRRGVVGASSLVLLALTCAYFGVVPAAPWLLLTVFFAGLLMVPRLDLKTAALLAVLTALVGLLTLWLLSGENERISALDDYLRDTLAITTVTEQAAPKDIPDPTPEPTARQEESAPLLLRQKTGMNPKTVILIVLIVLILLFLFVPAIFRDWLQKRRDRNRAGMDSADPAEAIRATFRYALLWLSAAGIEAGNEPYYALVPKLEQTLPGESVSVLSQVIPIWQEAAFSDHAMTDGQLDIVRKFQRQVEADVWQNADWKARVKLRFLYGCEESSPGGYLKKSSDFLKKYPRG